MACSVPKGFELLEELGRQAVSFVHASQARRSHAPVCSELLLRRFETARSRQARPDLRTTARFAGASRSHAAKFWCGAARLPNYSCASLLIARVATHEVGFLSDADSEACHSWRNLLNLNVHRDGQYAGPATMSRHFAGSPVGSPAAAGFGLSTGELRQPFSTALMSLTDELGAVRSAWRREGEDLRVRLSDLHASKLGAEERAADFESKVRFRKPTVNRGRRARGAAALPCTAAADISHH